MEEKIMAILNDICGAEEGELEPDTDLFEEEILDSFGVISLFVEIEKRLGVRFEPTEVERAEIATPAKILKQVLLRK
ncbi:MAG: D-alanine--poly(phosphoribitol) ligase subunit 2 [Oscillospiraceae bacterium]|jgi:D-alanine--poly(phosphoribitol) ligase subunit 2|nr:D-alanine--poly(phosphoribitol) ligase subunit 2 [Oscillospiraceae bacterium]